MKFYAKVIKPMLQEPCLQGFSSKAYPWRKHAGLYLESDKEKLEKEWKETKGESWDTLFFDEKYIELETIELNENDVIIITIDPKEIDLNQAYNISKMIHNSFPSNEIICKFKGIEIETAAAGTTSSENS